LLAIEERAWPIPSQTCRSPTRGWTTSAPVDSDEAVLWMEASRTTRLFAVSYGELTTALVA
jgi:hypothetical protein